MCVCVYGPVQTYKLNTVTYGTTCAPYLATRTIQQLARDEGEHYPLAASVTIRDIYMDDILTEWDVPLSNPIAKEWNDFVSTLPVIQNIHVPRLVIGKGRVIIHGFADGSTAAYGAVLYAQSISEEDVSTRLLCSKSRVAPVKPITIPRLELCACVLFSQLLEKASKAVHLEIVSDLTRDAFLATLKRFVARRRKCATISSDNAKTFVGANRELKRLHNLLKFPEEKLSSEGISWNFMPPRAPNFGGL
ncbi:DUF5641 domain-containing protein [Trichonephila clavipes]|nr:DUF5641 domain-containing protein [Trichonephila clavipes]